MKALILNSTGQTDEAFTLAKLALKNDMKSHVCWHVYGILWRSVKNNEEAIKAYRFALRLEPESPQILRDLSMLQVQLRDFPGYVQSRRTMLQQRASVRLNWTAMAMAQHLAGDLPAAESVLSTYEGTLKGTPSKFDSEHSEAILYKNAVIAETGDYKRALEHLESIAQTVLDKTAVMELRAEYLLKLVRNEEAEKAYRALIHRNHEYRAYYEGLEKALGLQRSQKQELSKLYAGFAEKYPRVDAARRIPLDFLDAGDPEFKPAVDRYLRNKLRKGVPSTFNNIKSLYSDPAKLQTVQDLVHSYVETKPSNGVNGDGAHDNDIHEPSLYFLAQHYNYKLSRDLSKATSYLDQCIALSPQLYDYHMLRARIAKHAGNPVKASALMNKARELDLKDRYINTKCAKYQLRNNENAAALETMAKFTRNEVWGGTLGDLIEMQSLWFLTEDGEAYVRNGDLGLALKRFHTVKDIFDVWEEDQYDFHTFSLRKGQIRAYIDMVRWEDTLRSHPFYTRVAVDAAEVYVRLHDHPALRNPLPAGTDPNDAKAVAKAKKDADRRDHDDLQKQEAERKKEAAKKANPDGETRKLDTDPFGRQLRSTAAPLDAAASFLAPLLDLADTAPAVHHAAFEVYIRKPRPFLALKALLAAFAHNDADPVAHEQTLRFRTLVTDCEANHAVLALAADALPPRYRDPHAPLHKLNDDYAAAHAASPAHQLCAIRARAALEPDGGARHGAEVLTLLEPGVGATLEDAVAGARLLRDLGVETALREAYVAKARARWAEAVVVEREALAA